MKEQRYLPLGLPSGLTDDLTLNPKGKFLVMQKSRYIPNWKTSVNTVQQTKVLHLRDFEIRDLCCKLIKLQNFGGGISVPIFTDKEIIK